MSLRRRFIQGNEDLTFIFHLKRDMIFKISILDNNINSEVKLDEISEPAAVFYIAQLIDITKQKLQQKQSA